MRDFKSRELFSFGPCFARNEEFENEKKDSITVSNDGQQFEIFHYVN